MQDMACLPPKMKRRTEMPNQEKMTEQENKEGRHRYRDKLFEKSYRSITIHATVHFCRMSPTPQFFVNQAILEK
ncbi:hypothetical protein NDU88_001860 [Pleurodeles waltl]|uniref:Uncharacterized protein n=1 Tax=Pleurodeles waltl TaxID=8319 RepID=A0AAV7LCQ1_PLEWA|nr:hypothetical protein NDU88_001860 [Pleurodeles waltl]